MKPEPNMDASTHLNRKLASVEKLMTLLDPLDQDDQKVYIDNKKKCKEISLQIVKELEKQDDIIFGNNDVITSSSNSIEDLTIDLSRFNQLDSNDVNEEKWV